MGAAGPEGDPQETIIGISVLGSLLGWGFLYRAWRGECQPTVLPPMGCGLVVSPSLPRGWGQLRWLCPLPRTQNPLRINLTTGSAVQGRGEGSVPPGAGLVRGVFRPLNQALQRWGLMGPVSSRIPDTHQGLLLIPACAGGTKPSCPFTQGGAHTPLPACPPSPPRPPSPKRMPWACWSASRACVWKWPLSPGTITPRATIPKLHPLSLPQNPALRVTSTGGLVA